MNEIYPVPESFKKTARISEAEYFERYKKSVEQPDEFWAEQAQKLDMGGTGLPSGAALINPTAAGTSSKPGKH